MPGSGKLLGSAVAVQSTSRAASRSSRFADGVGRLSAEAVVPHLSADYVAKCLDDLVGLGLIGPA